MLGRSFVAVPAAISYTVSNVVVCSLFLDYHSKRRKCGTVAFAIFKETVIQPFAKFGLTHPFWSLNWHTILATWFTLGAIVIITIFIRLQLQRHPNGVISFLTISFIHNFKNLVDQTLNQFHFQHFSFIFSLFIFILSCNLISLIPSIEEPTSDIMTTLSLGITTFIYIQISSITTNGLMHYLKGYLKPFFIMLPLNIVSNLASIVSISFRLFGNIFGGAVISSLWYSAINYHFITQLLGLMSGINLIICLFFVLFEGFIQAFVFSMLALTYLSIEVQAEEAPNTAARIE